MKKTQEEIEALSENAVTKQRYDKLNDYITDYREVWAEGYTACQEEDNLISFKDQTPEDYELVLYFNSVCWQVGYFVPSQSIIPGNYTHWKPLPNPPKK